jgi:hypothetical protein
MRYAPCPSPVPAPSRIGCLLAAALTLTLAGAAHAARPPAPLLSVPLEDLGYQGVPASYLLLGDSVLTVHFADDSHLLVTFTSRGLLKRLADAQEDDQDQNVTALLLELPSGKVVGRTTWRERDRGQYLWAIGHGRFILRIRSQLTLLNPVANLAHDKPFEEEPFLELHRQVVYITVSPTGDLVSIETQPMRKPKPKIARASSAASSTVATPPIVDQPAAPDPLPEIQINFLRLAYEQPAGKPEHLIVQSAGVVRAKNPIDIPATGDGYLDVSRESSGVFLFDFQGHGGKRLELSPFDTTCAPRPHFISRTEFIAFGCRGGDRQEMAGFNFHAEETWIDAFPNNHVFPFVTAAPAAGRFALSRTLLSGTYIDPDNLMPDQVSAQEVTVFQNWDGRTLFKLNASPFQRAGQNFDLAPAGQLFAIIHDAKIQVYPLPPVTAKDQAELKLTAADAPQRTEARIDLGGKPTHFSGTPVEATSDAAGATGAASRAGTPQAATSPALSQAAPSSQQAVPEPNHIQKGDSDPNQRRTPPTLYDADHPRQPGDPKPSAPQ